MHDVESRLQHVRQLIDEGQLVEATRLACSISSEFPDHACSWLLNGEIYRKLGRH